MIEVVNDEIFEKMALRNSSSLHRINKHKLQATALSKDKGITMQEKTRLAIKLMDGVKLNEQKYAKPKKEVERPLNDVEEVISVDIPVA